MDWSNFQHERVDFWNSAEVRWCLSNIFAIYMDVFVFSVSWFTPVLTYKPFREKTNIVESAKGSTRISQSMPSRLNHRENVRLLWSFCFRNHSSTPLYPWYGMCRPVSACVNCADWSWSIHYAWVQWKGSYVIRQHNRRRCHSYWVGDSRAINPRVVGLNHGATLASLVFHPSAKWSMQAAS